MLQPYEVTFINNIPTSASPKGNSTGRQIDVDMVDGKGVINSVVVWATDEVDAIQLAVGKAELIMRALE